MSKRSHKSDGKFKQRLTQNVIEIFEKFPKDSFNYKQVAAKLSIKDVSERQLVVSILDQLSSDDVLKHVGRGQYKFSGKLNEIDGIIDFTSRGAAYVSSELLPEDIFIHSSKTGKAFQKDKVRIRIFKHRGRTEGEVTSVIERSRREFIGTVQKGHNAVFVKPDDKNMPVDFFIDKEHLHGAKDGEKVRVRFLTWPSTANSPLAAVKERLGMPGDMDVEMHSILFEFGLPYKFPDVVEQASHAIKEADYEMEAAYRRDFRNTLTFTIDPHDAKDFDDALSYIELENGNYEIGVHIADVSFYVKPNSELDKEAYKRGNSVYLVDRVVPMLPEVLSNGLCSLRPNETKLTFSAVFEITPNGKIKSEWFGRTLIHSDKRYAYEEAQEIIEGKDDPGFDTAVRKLDDLAKILRKQRLGEGALDIESQEVRFKLDEAGNPLGIVLKISKDANKLIEEFMLLANRKIAEYVGKPKPHQKTETFVYRVHDEPNPEKLSELRLMLDQFGYEIKEVKDKPISFALNEVMLKAKEKDELNIIGPMVIKSMSKALYSTDNDGHYGLSFDYYTHFTSPIRRYADLLVHRIVWEKLTGKSYKDVKQLEDQCKHISGTEKKAVEAERSSTKFMQVKFMSDKVGQSFEGKITGVTDWGLFVELDETKCEGLVHISTIDGNYYLNDKTKMLESQREEIRYHIGMAVVVRVANTDLFKKQIDLILADLY